MNRERQQKIEKMEDMRIQIAQFMEDEKKRQREEQEAEKRI